jgi:Tfp pilus assembly protein PilO
MNRPYEAPPGPLGPDRKRGNPFVSRAGWAFFITLVAAVCLVYFLEVHRDQDEQLSALRRQAMMFEEKLDFSRDKADRLAVFRKTTERLRMRILEAETPIPSGLELPSLTEAITRTAGQFSVTVTRFEPLPATRKGGLTRVPISLGMEGSRESLFAFFERLSKLERRVNVSSFSMPRVEDKGESSVLKIDCMVEAFALELPE